MPHNLLAEYVMVHLASDGKVAPPYVALTADRAQAERDAIIWAERTFGSAAYEVVGGERVGYFQSQRWGRSPLA